jgi:hypothetical protein
VKSLFLVFVFFLPTQLGLHLWPDWAFINGIRIDYFAPTIYFTDVIVLVMLLLSLRGEQRPSNFLKGLKRLLRCPWSLAVTLGILINIYFSISPILSVYKWLKFFELFLLTVWIKNNFKTDWWPDFKKIILFTMIFQTLLALAQFINQKSPGNILYFLGERSFNAATPGIAIGNYWGEQLLRPYGTLPHPNILAGFLLIYYLLARNLATGVVCGFGMLLTISRLPGLAFALFFTQNFLPKVSAKLIGLFLLFVSAAIFLSVNEPSLSIRESLNLATIDIIGKNFIFGTGLGTNILALQSYSKDLFFNSQPLAFLQPVHNIYLLILSETGIFGLLIVIYFLMRKLSPGPYALAVLFLGFFDHYFLTVQQGQLLLSLVLGIILSCQKLPVPSLKIPSPKLLVK